MATIYVTKTGNDTTGDGSSGTPYLTIAKAESVAVAGDRVAIGPGEYAENNGTGRLTFDQDYASPVIFYAVDGPGTVFVSATTQRIVITGQNIYFQGITFVGVAGHGWVTRLEGSTVAHVRFIECEWLIKSSSGTVTQALGSDWTATGGSHPGIKVLGGRIRQAGYDRATGIYLDPGLGGGTVDGLVVRGVRAAIAGYCMRLGEGVTNADISNNDLVSFNPDGVTDHCLLLGVDGQTGALSSGRIAHNKLWNAHGHTLIVGAGVDGAQIIGNEVGGEVNAADSLDLGIVVKQARNVTVARNVVDARNAAGIYFKAAEDCQAFDNIVTVTRHADGSGLRTDLDPVDNGKCLNVVMRRNRVTATVGKAVDLGGDLADAGGTIMDENVYDVSASATIGTIRGTDVDTVREMRSAWSSYENPNNDRNSRVGAQSAPFGGAPLATLPS